MAWPTVVSIEMISLKVSYKWINIRIKWLIRYIRKRGKLVQDNLVAELTDRQDGLLRLDKVLGIGCSLELGKDQFVLQFWDKKCVLF